MNTVFRVVQLATLIFMVNACIHKNNFEPITAQGLFDRYVHEVYGSAGLDAFSSVTMKGEITIEGAEERMPFVLRQMEPDNRWFETDMMGMFVGGGCSMNQCWRKDPWGEVRLLTGNELEFEQNQADFYKLRHMDRYYKSLEIVTSDNDDGFPFYRVFGIRNNGSNDIYIFSKSTRLLSSIIFNSEDESKLTTIHHYDYKEYNGLKFPVKIVNESPEITMTMNVQTVDFSELRIADFKTPK